MGGENRVFIGGYIGVYKIELKFVVLIKVFNYRFVIR